MTAPSGYVLEPFREGADFTLYRGRQHGNPSPVLVVALSAKTAVTSESPAARARILARSRPRFRVGQPSLLRSRVTKGGRSSYSRTQTAIPWIRFLSGAKGKPLDLTRFLSIAIGLAAALDQVHRHGLIHKDIKPANVLVDDVGNVWLTGFGLGSQLPYERQAPAPPEIIIAGTLPIWRPSRPSA